MRYFAAMIVLVLPLASKADLLPPDMKWVAHNLKIENISEFPDYVFFVYPRDLGREHPGNSSVRVNAEGVAGLGGNPLARRSGIFLYAIPKSRFKTEGQHPEEDWFEKDSPEVFKAQLVNNLRGVNINDPRNEFWTYYKAKIEGGKLTLAMTRHDPGTPPPKENEKQPEAPQSKDSKEKDGDGTSTGIIAAAVAVAIALALVGVYLVRRK